MIIAKSKLSGLLSKKQIERILEQKCAKLRKNNPMAQGYGIAYRPFDELEWTVEIHTEDIKDNG